MDSSQSLIPFAVDFVDANILEGFHTLTLSICTMFRF